MLPPFLLLYCYYTLYLQAVELYFFLDCCFVFPFLRFNLLAHELYLTNIYRTVSCFKDCIDKPWLNSILSIRLFVL